MTERSTSTTDVRGTRARLRRPMGAVVGAVALVASLVTAAVIASTPAAADTGAGPGPIAQPTSSMVTADALPTAQIDGVAWKQVVSGNTVYVGGKFTTARPAGAAPNTNTVARTDLLAYDIRTGELTSFAPTLDGQVLNMTLSPDGSRLYVVGDFTMVNNQPHNRIAAFNTSDGSLVTSFTGGLNATTRAVIATDTTVYTGGSFSQANGVNRSRLAAFNVSGTLTAWAPTADYIVNDMVFNPTKSRIDIAGAFLKLNSTTVYGLGAVRASNGLSTPFTASQYVKSYGTSAGFTSLSTVRDVLYATSYNYRGTGNLEGTVAVNVNTGALVWLENCHGDTYGSFPVNNAVYIVGHPHFCQSLGGWPLYSTTTYRHTLAFTSAATGTLLHDATGYGDHYGQPSPSLYNWYPDMTNGTASGQNQAAWSVAGNSQYVVEAGEFPTVNGVAQQGLVRFATRPTAPAKSGPMVTGSHFVPTTTTMNPGAVRVAFQANWDRDDKTLSYKVVRDSNTANPVWSGSVDSEFWNRPMIGFTDTGLSPGRAYKYRLYVTDPDGNTVAGDNVTVTPTATSTLTPYDQTVLSQGASSYWPLDEQSGTVGLDNAGPNDIDLGAGITRGASSPVAGETYSTFSGASTAFTATRAPVPGPLTMSLSAWVRTTTPSGGEVAGFGNDPSRPASSTNDRMLYLDNGGLPHFGVLTDTAKVNIAGGAAVNDGSWHHLVGTLDSGVIRLFVDGTQVATQSSVNPETPVYSGWWRIGGDSLVGWGTASSNDLNGDIGGVAVYPTALTAAQVNSQYVASAAATSKVAADSFSRTTTGGLGSADTGGAWSPNGAANLFSVDGSGANVTMSAPGSGPYATLPTVSAGDVDVRTDVSMQQAVTGGGAFAMLAARRVGTSDYRVKLKFPSSGAATLYLSKVVDGTESTLVSKTISTVTPQTATMYSVEMTVQGSSPATLQARVWPTGAAAPAWQLSATDTTPALAGSGSVGMLTYLGVSNAAPVTARFDNFGATLLSP